MITLFLFPESVYKNMNKKDMVKFALEAINTKRKGLGLRPLKLDKILSKRASNICDQLKTQSHQAKILPLSGMKGRREILSFVIEDLNVWPSELEKKISSQALHHIGLGISFQKNEKNQKMIFWVTLIF